MRTRGSREEGRRELTGLRFAKMSRTRSRSRSRSRSNKEDEEDSVTRVSLLIQEFSIMSSKVGEVPLLPLDMTTTSSLLAASVQYDRETDIILTEADLHGSVQGVLSTRHSCETWQIEILAPSRSCSKLPQQPCKRHEACEVAI
eukprot:754730-Hanusia_phi.AAC.1